ncbi:MAG TPA: energy transducer TonB [Acidisarcina sp.]
MRARLFVLLLTCCLLTISAAAQTVPDSPAAADPSVFMQTATAATSLVAADMNPWHLRAKYQQFGDDGLVKQEGTIEAWFASAEKSKITYSSAGTSHDEYRVDKRDYVTGQARWSALEETVRGLLLHPLPEESTLPDLVFVEKDLTLGGLTLQCYYQGDKVAGFPPQMVLTNSKGEKTLLSPVTWSYCFRDPLPAVRMAQGIHIAEGTIDSRQTFNEIVRVHDHYLAKSIRLANHGKPWIAVDVEQVDPTLTVDEASLTPPADAKQAPPRRVNVSSGVMEGKIVSRTKPVYPDYARQAHIQGTVVLRALIDKEGKMATLQVVGGPTALQQAALDSAKTWVYKPYLLNGEPVEVETQINVVFSMGGY